MAGEYVDFRLGGEALNRMIAAAHSGEHDGLLLWQRRRQPEFSRGVINGGSDAYAVIDAPNANISFSGGSNFYGQVIGGTIKDTGGTNIYYDQSLNTPGPNNNAFFEIALRELSY